LLSKPGARNIVFGEDQRIHQRLQKQKSRFRGIFVLVAEEEGNEP